MNFNICEKCNYEPHFILNKNGLSRLEFSGLICVNKKNRSIIQVMECNKSQQLTLYDFSKHHINKISQLDKSKKDFLSQTLTLPNKKCKCYVEHLLDSYEV